MMVFLGAVLLVIIFMLWACDLGLRVFVGLGLWSRVQVQGAFIFGVVFMGFCLRVVGILYFCDLLPYLYFPCHSLIT